MEATKNLLVANNLVETIPLFEEHNITMELLVQSSNQDLLELLKEIFPKLGPRMRIINLVREQKTSQISSSDLETAGAVQVIKSHHSLSSEDTLDITAENTILIDEISVSDEQIPLLRADALLENDQLTVSKKFKTSEHDQATPSTSQVWNSVSLALIYKTLE